MLDPADISPEISCTSAQIENGNLVAEFDGPTRHSTHISLEWLRQHAYPASPLPCPPSPSVSASTILWDGQTTSELCASLLPLLKEHGCVIVRRPKEQTEEACCAETEQLISCLHDLGLVLRGSHFGRLEDLRTDNSTNQNTDQLGYTDAAVDLHTDQPFIEHPPQFQLLQCIRCATSGGSNYIADSWAVSAYIQATHSRYHHLLTTVPVTFHRRQAAFESIHVSPILQGKQIRYSYFTIAPFKMHFAEMAEWYDAYSYLSRCLRNPDFQFKFLLQPGDFVLYNNHRMVHARSAFSGRRWMRGVYFDADSSVGGPQP
jgi:alpha-ketoglutarate-dependent taurine dioxygenase